MVIRSPIFPMLKASLEDFNFSILKIFKLRNKNITENKTRYQTNGISLREMSLPNTPVNPAKRTAMCSIRYDFFMKKGLCLLINNLNVMKTQRNSTKEIW